MAEKYPFLKEKKISKMAKENYSYEKCNNMRNLFASHGLLSYLC